MSYDEGSRRDLTEQFTDFLTGCAKLVFSLGTLVSVVAIGLLVFTCFATKDSSTAKSADALNNVGLFQKLLIVGVMGAGVGSGYLFWGEDLLGVLQLLSAAALYFAPLYIPMAMGSSTNMVVDRALSALQSGGTVFGLIAVPVLVLDIATRTRQRIKVGVKADQMRYGKGIKEETTKQNIWMGKCWQLPFCRKFVRERCPIFHSKKTCWKELVGCMCEESVIRNAMENRPIPKDALLAARMIPQNHKLTLAQKQERCRNCVIYNEHQRHKYKAAVPGTVAGFVAFYFLLHGPLLGATGTLIDHVNHVIRGVTLGSVNAETPQAFVEMLLITILIVLLSYSMKLIEFLIFKLKI